MAMLFSLCCAQLIMIVTKKLDVNRVDDTQCDNLVLNAYRTDEGDDGVQFIAWHKFEGGWLIQTDFIKMKFEHIHSFIRDYSTVSAQDYVDRFVP
jgi:hypothetical protein